MLTLDGVSELCDELPRDFHTIRCNARRCHRASILSRLSPIDGIRARACHELGMFSAPKPAPMLRWEDARKAAGIFMGKTGTQRVNPATCQTGPGSGNVGRSTQAHRGRASFGVA